MDADDRLQLLSNALRAFAEATADYQELLGVIARTVADVVADGCIVRLLTDGEWLTPVAFHLPFETRVDDAGRAARARAFMEAPRNVDEYAWGRNLIETGTPFLLPHLDVGEFRTTVRADVAEAYEIMGIHSMLVVCLRARGQSIGTLSLFRFKSESACFDERDGSMAQALADHAALAITNSRLLQTALHELTERERAEAALHDTEAQLRHAQKMDAVGRLAGGVAHDFNNVLSVILSYAELIRGDLRPGEPLRADVDEIFLAGNRAAELTRQLLAFSRQQALEPRVLDLNQTIAGMANMLRRLLGADVVLTILPASKVWSVKADPGQLEQVLMNLAVNARDAMPNGGKLTIETQNVELDEHYAATHHEVRAGSYVMVAATDSGTGMDRATLGRIFEPFFTTKDKGKGTGLGLATVFGIVKQSGGHIWVYSEIGHGTTFKVYLPRVVGDVTHETPDRRAPDVVGGHETVLLVDDDDQVRAVARGILRRNGYVVLDASNGGEALLIGEQHDAKIHLLVTDVVLPRMNGRQIAERITTMRPGIKVLFMSGYPNDAILQHAVLESDVAYLQKPLTPDSLARKVRAILDA